MLFQDYNCELSQFVDAHLSTGATQSVNIDKLTRRALLCYTGAVMRHSSAESIPRTLEEH